MPQGGFDNHLQARECLMALRNGVVPSKFIYVGAAAATHDAFATTAADSQMEREVDLEVSCLTSAWGDTFSTLSVLFDIGPGNGRHALTILKRIIRGARGDEVRHARLQH